MATLESARPERRLGGGEEMVAASSRLTGR